MSIVLQDLVKRFSSHPAVDHVSLQVDDGELLVLLGPSGSGKSTVLRLIAGLLPLEQGRIWLHGRDVTNLSPQERNTGFVFQNYSLFRHMTVAENIEFGLSVRKAPASQRTAKRDELLSLVGLAGLGNRYPRQLSGGQQQRVAVARALAFEPSVLLMDEPFGALDVKIREQLRQALKDIQRKLKVTTILVTHDQEEAFELADRIGVIDRGKLLEVGPPAALYRSPQKEFVATFLGGANLLAGQHEHGRINLGALRLSDAASYATPDPEGRLEVLFRPEDLEVAFTRQELTTPVLGQGIVEQVLFLGTLQRLRLRLQPLPGTWPLPTDYGDNGVPIQIARVARPNGPTDFQVGQTVWVGINNFHILPRVPLAFLLPVDPSTNMEDYCRFASHIALATDGPVTLLATADEAGQANDLLQRARERLAPQTSQLTLQSAVGRSLDHILGALQAGAPGGGEYDFVMLSDDLRGPARTARGERLSRQLARQSPVPVLLHKGDHSVIRRILFCTAGGEPGKRAVVFGGRLARRTGASTTLLYVDPPVNRLPPPTGLPRRAEDPRTRPWIQRHLDEGARTLLNQGIRTEVRVRQGIVTDEVLAESVEGNYDLVVIGGHLAGGSSRLVEHDFSSDILHRLDRPVLIVRGRVQM